MRRMRRLYWSGAIGGVWYRMRIANWRPRPSTLRTLQRCRWPTASPNPIHLCGAEAASGFGCEFGESKGVVRAAGILDPQQFPRLLRERLQPRALNVHVMRCLRGTCARWPRSFCAVTARWRRSELRRLHGDWRILKTSTHTKWPDRREPVVPTQASHFGVHAAAMPSAVGALSSYGACPSRSA